MMPLHYTLSDAHDWAGFSGDYNPVHFDASWAKNRAQRILAYTACARYLMLKPQSVHLPAMPPC